MGSEAHHIRPILTFISSDCKTNEPHLVQIIGRCLRDLFGQSDLRSGEFGRAA